jgi:hypothetical protein
LFGDGVRNRKGENKKTGLYKAGLREKVLRFKV